jgi:hypothetical protein
VISCKGRNVGRAGQVENQVKWAGRRWHKRQGMEHPRRTRTSLWSSLALSLALGVLGCRSESQSEATVGPTGAPSPPSTNPERPLDAEAVLKNREFVFVKEIPSGASTVRKLYAYDLDSGAERLVADLDSNPLTYVNQCSVSLDRRSVAFTSANFRPMPDEVQHPKLAIWSVGLDGKSYKRMTPPLFIETLVRDRGQDHQYQANYYLFDPVWMNDNATVSFRMQLWYVGVIATNVSVVQLLGSTAGDFQGYPCGWSTPTTSRKADGTVLVARTHCTADMPGLYEYTGTPLAKGRSLISDPILSDQPGESWTLSFGRRHAWLPDGSGLLLTVVPDKGPKNRVVRWNFATGKAETIYTPERPLEEIWDLFAGPDGDVLLQIAEKADPKVLLRLKRLDLGTKTAITVQSGGTDIGVACF